MCLFHRKKEADIVKADKQLISENEKTMDVLIVLAEQSKNEKIVTEFKQIKEKLKYLIASDNEKVIDFDKKIKNAIEDLRIFLVKDDSGQTPKAEKLITQIKITIADRNAHM